MGTHFDYDDLISHDCTEESFLSKRSLQRILARQPHHPPITLAPQVIAITPATSDLFVATPRALLKRVPDLFGGKTYNNLPSRMWGWFGGGGAAQKRKDSPKNAILGLRSQLDMLQKRDKYLQSQIDEQDAVARKNINTNKNAAKAALKRKKTHQHSQEQTQAQIGTLEQQINSIESANINRETLAAMEKAGEAMKQIHGKLTPGKVDETMDKLREQNDLSEEIVQAITGNQPANRSTTWNWKTNSRPCSKSTWTRRCSRLATCQRQMPSPTRCPHQPNRSLSRPRNRQWRTTKRQSWRSCAPKWPCRPLDMHVTKRSGLQLGPLTAYRCLELRGCDMHSCFHPQPSFFDTLSVVFCGVGVFRCVSLASRNPLLDRSDVAWSCSCCL